MLTPKVGFEKCFAVEEEATMADSQNTHPGQEEKKDGVSAVAGRAERDIDTVKSKAVEIGSDLADEAKKQAGVIEKKAASFAGEQKNAAADRLGGVASALNDVAKSLKERDDDTIARYARDLADGVDRASHTLKDREVGDLVAMAEDFGRKQPVAFLGLAALAGFASGRFALASAAKRKNESSAPSSQPDVTPRPTSGIPKAAGPR